MEIVAAAALVVAAILLLRVAADRAPGRRVRRRPVAGVVVVAALAATVAVLDDSGTTAATVGPPQPNHAQPQADEDLVADTESITVKPEVDGHAAAVSAEPALEDAVDEFVEDDPRVRGAVVAISFVGDHDPEAVVIAGVDGESTPSTTAEDAYGVLSITKTFTEALVLREAARGTIDLDRPVPPIAGVPTATGEAATITPRMLLQHSSGLVNYMSARRYDPTRRISPAQIVALGLADPLLHSPGTEARYSNTNFHWLGLLLEHVTGRTYADLVAQLAAEVGLQSTSLDPADRPGWTGFASGGIRSTVSDVARWGAALFTPDRVLPAAQLSELTTVGGLGVGLGLWPSCPCSSDAAGREVPEAIGQIVANGGLLYFPEDGMVLVVRMDLADASPAERVAAVASAVRPVLNQARLRSTYR